MSSVDWTTVFLPSGSLLEIVIRGSLMYLGLLIVLRVILKRQSGGLSVFWGRVAPWEPTRGMSHEYDRSAKEDIFQTAQSQPRFHETRGGVRLSAVCLQAFPLRGQLRWCYRGHGTSVGAVVGGGGNELDHSGPRCRR